MPPKKQTKRVYKTPAQRQKNYTAAAKTIQSAVRKYMAKKIETKKSNTTSSDLVAISHNSFVFADSNVLLTTPGITDPTNSNTANRIGDEINLKGISFKFMLENNHRYSDVNFRILIV